MTATRIDLMRELKPLYSARPEPALVDVPPLRYLMVDGRGKPETTPAFQLAIQALFSVSYTLKFTFKRGPLEVDYRVMPVEGLWDANGDWTLMILQPEQVDDELVAEAIASKGLPVDAVKLDLLEEGRCAQILHLGPYDAEAPTIERLHGFIAAEGYELRGRHHEIYLGDPRRAAPAKLRTILRQPVGP